MRLTKLFIIHCSLFIATAFTAAAASPLVVMPYTYVGRVVDASHIAFDGSQSVELRLKSLDGNLLAKCTTYTSSSSAYNYRLEVPMSSTPVAGRATSGQLIVIDLVDQYGKVWSGLVPPAKCAIGAPGGICHCDIVLAEDANGNGVADDYEEYMSWLMYLRGIDGDYDPQADSDGDGASNYAEYIAGTDPFDARDSLAISALDTLKGLDGDTLAFTFLMSAGRVYTITQSAKLGPAASWSSGTFKTALEAASVKRLVTSSVETGYRTIYLLRLPGEKSSFYKLNVE